MTGIDQPSHRHGDGPLGPPWPVDVLADLHAGALDERVAADLWPRVRQDPDAVAVLDALDATRAELSGLAAAPPIPIPAHVAARLDAALAMESRGRFGAAVPVQAPAPPRPSYRAPMPGTAPPGPVVDLATARRKRNQRLGWATGVLVAAAAVAVAVIAIPRGSTGGTPSAANGGGAMAISRGDLGTTTLSAAIGRSDYGPYTDPAKRAACLSANGQDPNRTPAGAMQVTLDGRPGTLFVLTIGQLARYRLLVVGPDCAANHPDTLADSTVGGVAATPTR